MPKSNPKVRRVKAWGVLYRGYLHAISVDRDEADYIRKFISIKKELMPITISYALPKPPKKTE